MKQIIPFLFIIENVKNDDKYISLINNFMQYITAKIKDDESFNNDSYEPVINILLLGKTARWFNETPNFISISDFVYKDISPEDDDIDYTSLKVKMVEHGFASNAIRNTITYYLAHLGKKGNYQHIPDDCFLKTIFVNFNPNNKRELLSSNNNSFSTSVFEEKEFFHFYDLYIKEFADTFFNIKIEDNDGLKYFYYEDLKSVGTGMDKLFMQFNSKSVEFARLAKAKSPSRPSTSLFSEAFDDLMASFKKEKNETSKVFYSLVCEKTFQKNENFIVDFVMYEKRFKKIINMVKQKYRNASVSEGEDLTINSNANIEVVLTSPNIPSLKDVASFSWGRKYKIVQLGGMIPEDYSLGNVILEIDVLVEGIRVSTLKTSIRIGYDYHFSEMVLGRTDTKKVFFSYSSEDRDTVLEVVSRVRAGYGDDIEFFLDVLSLRSGENWEKRLYKEIKNNDTFCLVWSRHAYKSPWVQKEWKYALSHKGLRAFAPINLDSSNPDLAPIPKKLQKIHFANYKIIKQK